MSPAPTNVCGGEGIGTGVGAGVAGGIVGAGPGEVFSPPPPHMAHTSDATTVRQVNTCADRNAGRRQDAAFIRTLRCQRAESGASETPKPAWSTAAKEAPRRTRRN